MRRLNKNKKIINEILEQLNSLEKDFSPEILLELLREGEFIIILDGYDEISLNERETVTADIQDFISKASNNHFIITSRPENALSCFGNFQEFRIKPLTKKEAFELLRKYDFHGHISTLLIKKLQEKEMSNIDEFLTNPLLVSLLFTAFEHKQAIPFKKYLFYRQVYDANFESHDLTKGDSYTHNKYSKLEIDDFHRVLRHIGFSCLKQQKVEFSKDELLKLIKESKGFCIGLKFNNSDFLLDILKTVPIFTQDGNYYRWVHKSLQEYFAAQFIYLDTNEKQTSILKSIYNHKDLDKFINVLDLYYDMDYKTFRNIIEFNLLKEYNEYNFKKYNNIESTIPIEYIIERKQLMFLTDYFFLKRNEELEDEDINKILKDKNINHLSWFIIHRKGFYVLISRNPKEQILILLLNKKNKIASSLKTGPYPGNNFIGNFEVEYTIEITDNRNCILNDFKNFINTNEIIKSSKIFPIVINHDMALKKFEEIKSSIEIEKTSDFLL